MEWNEFKVGQILGHKNAIGGVLYKVLVVQGQNILWETVPQAPLFIREPGRVTNPDGWYIVEQAPTPADKFKHHKDRVENRHLKRATMR